MFKIETGIAMPKQVAARGTEPAPVRKAIEAYNTAYRSLYGVSALDCSYDPKTKFVTLAGVGEMSLKVLRERTKTLIYRKG